MCDEARHADPRRAAGRGRGRAGRHGAAGHGRHAGPAPGQAAGRHPLPRRRARPQRRGLQLPAGRRRRHEHRLRVRDELLGPGLRRLRLQARPVHPAHGPWQEGTPWSCATWTWEDGSPVLASPGGAEAPAGAAGRARLGRLRRHRARVHRVPRQLRGGLGQGLPRPAPGQRLQRRLLAAGHGPDRAPAAAHPQLHGRGRPAGRVGQGRVQLRPARDRLPLRRRPGHRRRARHLQERGQGDRRPGRLQPDVHVQVQRARGQLLPHPLQRPRRRRRRGDDGRRHGTPG